nr:unnamed protein product [Callosobruchus chinensis]
MIRKILSANEIEERRQHSYKQHNQINETAQKNAKIYKGGVVVVVETDTPCTGVSRRLFNKFKGPCRITKVNDRGPRYEGKL